MIPFGEIIDAVLLTITPREENVLRLYYGLGAPRQSARVIGESLCIGAKGVHYIRRKALRKVARRFSNDLGYPPGGLIDERTR